jgi:hypothetical protein
MKSFTAKEWTVRSKTHPWPAKECAKSGIWRRCYNRKLSLYATPGAFLRAPGFALDPAIDLFAVKLFLFLLPSVISRQLRQL